MPCRNDALCVIPAKSYIYAFFCRVNQTALCGFDSIRGTKMHIYKRFLNYQGGHNGKILS